MDVAVTCERLVFFDRALGFRRDRGQLSLRRLDLVAQRMIVEIRLGEFCRRSATPAGDHALCAIEMVRMFEHRSVFAEWR